METITKNGKSIIVYLSGNSWIAQASENDKSGTFLAKERSRQLAIDCAFARFDALVQS